MPETLSNLTMYVLARDYYLKHLLDAGKISMSQFENMAQFLYRRFEIEGVENVSWQSAALEIPVQTERAEPEMMAESSTESPAEPISCATAPSAIPAPAVEVEYVSLTDIARQYNSEEPSYIISSWMRSSATMDFLCIWEETHNPNFDQEAAAELRSRLRGSSSNISLKQWIQKTGAIGLKSKLGNRGGTYAHPIIFCEFLTYLSPKYKLLLLETASMPHAQG